MVAPNGKSIQLAMLEAIEGVAAGRNGAFEPGQVLRATMANLGHGAPGTQDKVIQKAVLITFNDFLRRGIVGFGDPKSVGHIDLGSWPNFCHVTDEGNELLKQASRDPLNPRGYLAHLDEEFQIDPTTREYVEESLDTYTACCYKATAVLIGAAVENLVLNVRDELVARLLGRGETPTKKLVKGTVKEVTEAIHARVMPDLTSECKKNPDNRAIKEETESRLLPIAAEFRRLRNDAGHPASLGPVKATDVHANLLQFPSTANLLARLKKWISEHYA